jgi:hypothetical protein
MKMYVKLSKQLTKSVASNDIKWKQTGKVLLEADY